MPWQMTSLTRRAQRLGEALVTERRRVGAVVEQELVADPVELVGRDAGRDLRRRRLRQRLGGDRGRPAHPLDRLGVLDLRTGEARRAGLADVLRSRDARRAPADEATRARGDTAVVTGHGGSLGRVVLRGRSGQTGAMEQ